VIVTFEVVVHEPHPRSEQDWDDIYTEFEDAAKSVGCTVTGMLTDEYGVDDR
jgi:hypothetical protein